MAWIGDDALGSAVAGWGFQVSAAGPPGAGTTGSILRPRRGSMATLSITKKHHLSHKKAKEAAQKVAEDLHDRFELKYAWHGDRVAFSRPGLSGELHIDR